MKGFKQISITDIPGFRIGYDQDGTGATGLSVIISETGMGAGVDVRGGGPASRETTLLNPMSNATCIHALVLSGGSAFGLGAANGVMEELAERGIGFETEFGYVPLVVQSDLYDLGIGKSDAYPDAQMGKRAVQKAFEKSEHPSGNYGAGLGCTVGKLFGMARSTKTGIGTAALQKGDVMVGAIVAVNALGDIFDFETGEKIAGLKSEDGKTFLDSETLLYELMGPETQSNTVTNTTIGCILTNAILDKAQLTKVASMAQNGYARSINPVHTSMDGDTIYALSSNEVQANPDFIGTLAARVMAMAIKDAVLSAESEYGLTNSREILNLNK